MNTQGFKKFAIATAATAAFAAALTGCGGPTVQGSMQKAAGSVAAGRILMSINPEIEIEYDKAGLITELEAKNDDGREVVADMQRYEGRPVHEVAAELIADIHAHGFFDNKIDGHDKNVVLKLEPGSGVPAADFLAGIEAAVEAQAGALGLASDAVVVNRDMENEEGLIGLDAAKDIAMAQMGLDHATFLDHEYELDDGVYELKFIADGVEYEYEIDGKTGKVLEADIEHNDDWDDKDSWDDEHEETYDADDDMDDIDGEADDTDDVDDVDGPDDPDGAVDDADDPDDPADAIDDPADIDDVDDADDAGDSHDVDDLDDGDVDDSDDDMDDDD